MKVTFIQPYYHNVWEALGIGYIIRFLRDNYKGDLEINFFQSYFDPDVLVVEEASKSNIVFFSCTSPAYAHGLYLANNIKWRSCGKAHIVFGGWHPTALPDEVIVEECVDQVVVGEGEIAVVRIVEGERQAIVRGMNIYPYQVRWPDRKAIKNERTVDLCETINGKRTASFQLNRGCKVHCAYCSEVKMTGRYNSRTNPVRTRDYKDLLDEINYVKHSFGINYFKFVDATFDKDISTVEGFCIAKISRGNEMPWEANIHPAFIQKEETFRLMAAANCQQINVGVESGSQRILNQIGKGTRVEHIENVFDYARKYDIERRAFFILGMPDEDHIDWKHTDELIERIDPDYSGFTILCPYAGSDFYDPVKHRDIDWSQTDEYSNDFWESKRYNNETLKTVQNYFTKKYKGKLCERQT